MAEDSNSKTYEGWAIVELFGHNQIAGHVSEQTIAGAAFLRVDVPEANGMPPFTKFFGGAAIYAITPTTQEVATVAAGNLTVRPVSPWIVPKPAPRRVELPPPTVDADDEEEEYDDEGIADEDSPTSGEGHYENLPS